MKLPKCVGCLASLNPVMALLGAQDGMMICMDCVRARQKAAMGKGCKCGRKRRESEVKHAGGININGTMRGGRSWISCLRCLGQVRQLS